MEKYNKGISFYLDSLKELGLDITQNLNSNKEYFKNLQRIYDEINKINIREYKNLEKENIYNILENISEELFFYEKDNWIKPGMDLGLNRMKKLLKVLNNPQDKLKVIHVGGTNGKGSTCSYINSILIEADYKVGLFTSPSIIAENESVKINNNYISFSEMYKLLIFIKEKWINIYGTEDFITYFECLTALSIMYFFENKVDFAIFEVGLGGRNDATNVFRKKVLSIISNIGIDHIGVLGSTLEEIAFEKGGIIQDHDNVIVYPSPESALDVLKGICKEKNALMEILNIDCIKDIVQKKYYSIFSFCETKNIKINMVGNYQIYNASLSLLALNNLKNRNLVEIGEEQIKKGFENTTWPGRLEWISKSDNILIDGAHNEDSINNLVEFLNKQNFKNIKILMGVLKDKEHKKIFKKISTLNGEYYLTEVPFKGREMKVEEMKKELLPYTNKIKTFKNPIDGIEDILKNRTDDDLIVITGSLYLISKVREYLIGLNNKLIRK